MTKFPLCFFIFHSHSLTGLKIKKGDMDGPQLLTAIKEYHSILWWFFRKKSLVYLSSATWSSRLRSHTMHPGHQSTDTIKHISYGWTANGETRSYEVIFTLDHISNYSVVSSESSPFDSLSLSSLSLCSILAMQM